MEECYLCNRTSSQRWYPSPRSTGLFHCNACNIFKNSKACPYCGIEGSESSADAVFICTICFRDTHYKCNAAFRGQVVHEVCVVCEIRHRIRIRDYNRKIITLQIKDIPALLNYHIYFFSRYFRGTINIPVQSSEGNSKKPKQRSIATTEQAMSAQIANPPEQVVRGEGESSRFTPNFLSRGGGNKVWMPMQTPTQTAAQENLNWASASSIFSSADEGTPSRWDAIWRQQDCRLEPKTTKVPSNLTLQPELDTCTGISEPVLANLRMLAVCYFRRPFPRGDGGTFRRLDPIEAYLRFSADYGLLAAMALTNREARDIAFRMLCADGGGSPLSRSIKAAREINAPPTPPPELALAAFLSAIARHGRRPPPPVDATVVVLNGPEPAREAVETAKLCAELGLHDAWRARAVCDQYPTPEELAARREVALLATGRRRAEDETARGGRVPFPLGEGRAASQILCNLRTALLDAFHLFARPDSGRAGPRGGSSAGTGDSEGSGAVRDLREGFALLDADADGFIAIDEATSYLGSPALAELFVATCAGPQAVPAIGAAADGGDDEWEAGVTWGEFAGGGEEDSAGAAWLRLLAEFEGPSARLRDAVLLLQLGAELCNARRASADEGGGGGGGGYAGPQPPAWPGFLCDVGRGMELVCCEVFRPGPADGLILNGDVVLAVGPDQMHGLSPAVALTRLAASRPAGPCAVAVRRDGVECVVELSAPAQPRAPQPPPRSRVCAVREQAGRLPLSGLFRLAGMLGLTPGVVSPEELMLRCDDMRPGHMLARDGPMEFGWEEVQGLVAAIATHDSALSAALDVLAASAWAVVARLPPDEQREGALLLFLGVPRYDGPDGPAWARVRHARQLASAHHEAAAGRAVGGEARVRSAAEVAAESDGLGEYMAACRALGVIPLRSFCKQAATMSPTLHLSGCAVAARQAAALGAGLVASRHVEELIIDGAGLSGAGAVAICMAAAQCRRLRVVDLSHNPLGHHDERALTMPAADSGPSGAHSDAAAALAKLVVEARGLVAVRLSGVGFREAEACRLCAALGRSATVERLDLSGNFIGETGARAVASLIKIGGPLRFVNLSWSNLTQPAISAIQEAVRHRNRHSKPQQPSATASKGRKLTIAAAAGSFTRAPSATSVRASGSSRAGALRRESRAQAADGGLGGEGDSDGGVSYEYRDLLDRPADQALSALDRVLERRAEDTEGFGGSGSEEARVAGLAAVLHLPEVVVLLDAPVRGALHAHFLPAHGERPDASPAPTGSARATTARAGLTDSTVAVTVGAGGDRPLTDAEYLDLKAQAEKLGRTPEERLAVVRYATDGRRLGAVQVWEQLESFAGTGVRFAATTLLLSKLRERGDAEAVHAMQALFAERARRNSVVVASEVSQTSGVALRGTRPPSLQVPLHLTKAVPTGSQEMGWNGVAAPQAKGDTEGGGGQATRLPAVVGVPQQRGAMRGLQPVGAALRVARRLGAAPKISTEARAPPGMARRVLFRDFLL